MKKILILNEYLSNFWFTTFLLLSGFLAFSYSPYLLVNYSELGILGFIENIFAGFLFYFLLPLGVLSIIVFTSIWLKNKNNQCFIFLLITILALCLNFFVITKLSIKAGDIRIEYDLRQSEVILKNYQMNRLK